MIVGVMQPYLFPYIGYWQLLNGVDTFVMFDDVNYINRGWINRNRILIDGQPKYFNVQMRGASQNQLINEVALTNDVQAAEKQVRAIELAYKKAPYFTDCFPMIAECMRFQGENLSDFVCHSIRETAKYLGINTTLLLSSEIEKDNSLRGQDKILDICKRLGATEYWNPIGGTELYDKALFSENGMALHFLKANGDIKYKQFREDAFEPFLSIIDVMMFNSVERIQEMLNEYTLL